MDSLKTHSRIYSVIEYQGKYFGHNIIDGDWGFDREWHENIRYAIKWNSEKTIPLDRIFCPEEMREQLLKANIIQVKVTTTFEIL